MLADNKNQQNQEENSIQKASDAGKR